MAAEEGAVTVYVEVIVVLHLAFAGVFFFLSSQGESRFARLLAGSWLIEGGRAAILLPGLRALGGSAEHWFAAADALCVLANWWLLAGCAALTGRSLPRWLGPAYFWSSVPVVWFNRYLLAAAVGVAAGETVKFWGVLANLIVLFVPVAVTRCVVMVWLFGLWRKTRLPGASVAAIFCVPYAVLAIAVPIQFYFSWAPEWVGFVWCVRVLGFSLGMLMLVFNLQQLAVRKSEQQLALAQELAKLGSWELDATTGEVTWSMEMYRLFGREVAQGPAKEADFLAVVHEEDREPIQRRHALVTANGQVVGHGFRLRQPSGDWRWIQGMVISQRDADGRLVRKIGVEQDITERKRAEEWTALQHGVTQVLAEGQALDPTMARILEVVARGVGADVAAFWTATRGREVLRCAQVWTTDEARFAELVGLTRRLEYGPGRGLPGRLLAARAPLFVAAKEDGPAEEFPRRDAGVRAGLCGGGGFPIMLRGEIYGVVEFFTSGAWPGNEDLLALFRALGMQIGQYVERQNLEAQYRQSQKMEAVGTLAGGIAHDFNNVLTAISGYCELAQLELPAGAPAGPYLQAVREASHRATELVRQIMAFSRRQAPQRQPLVLSTVVAEAVKLLRATTPASVEIQTLYAQALRPVLADATAIHQIVVNLGTNACHAMRERGGRLRLQVAEVMVDEDYARGRPGLKVGDYVELVVEDTGCGMEPATVARIFEPFFTTKAPGEGTGLGLSVVHGIVASHEGAIFVYSQPGEGTRFHVYFPVQGAAEVEQKDEPTDLPRGRGERILYVEDETALARMGQQMLIRLGYGPVVCERPTAALAQFRAAPEAFALLVTDLTMPEMTGLELAKALREVRPNLPVVLMSGYGAALTAEKLAAAGVCEFINKPHSLLTLARAVAIAVAKGAVEPSASVRRG